MFVACGFYLKLMFMTCVFFFKQKTAYELRISDWSSDVCSSDLSLIPAQSCAANLPAPLSTVWRISVGMATIIGHWACASMKRRSSTPSSACLRPADRPITPSTCPRPRGRDRKSGVSGKSVSVRVDLGGRRIIKKKKVKQENETAKSHNKTIEHL